MVCSHSLAGVALDEAPKAEVTELAPEAVGAGLQTAIKTRVVSTVAEEGLPGRPVLLVELPSGGFGLHNAKLGHLIRFGSISKAADLAGGGIPASRSF
jgi:hypothetical protein